MTIVKRGRKSSDPFEQCTPLSGDTFGKDRFLAQEVTPRRSQSCQERKSSEDPRPMGGGVGQKLFIGGLPEEASAGRVAHVAELTPRDDPFRCFVVFLSGSLLFGWFSREATRKKDPMKEGWCPFWVVFKGNRHGQNRKPSRHVGGKKQGPGYPVSLPRPTRTSSGA